VFNDVDHHDHHTVSVAPKDGVGAGYIGSLTASVDTDTCNASGPSGDGQIGWSFSVPDGATDYLSAGETLTQTYTITVDDGQGGTATKDVTITITGTNEGPTVDGSVQSGGVTEDSGPDPLTASGNFGFGDVDHLDTHTVSVTPDAAGYLGTFSASVGTDTNNPSGPSVPGQIDWSFSVGDDATDYLSAGETLTQVYHVQIDDGHGGTVTKDVTVTITGTNEGPTVDGSIQSGGVTEDSGPDPLTASGAFVFNDVDHHDHHTVSVAPKDGVGAGYIGSLTASVDTDTYNASGPSGDGQIGWSFSVPDGATDYLSAGETLTQTYTITIDDGHGGTATKDVTITITGTNEGPTVDSSVQSGGVTEDSGPDPLTASGAFVFNDVDHHDHHTVSVAPKDGVGAGYIGSLTASVDTDTYNASGPSGDGQIGWSFSVPDGATDYLSAGETLTQTYTITVDDGQGGTATKDVTITITGSNEGPTVDSSVQSGGVTEDSGPDPLTASGAFVFNDVDHHDHHTVSVAPKDGVGAGYIGSLTASVDTDTYNASGPSGDGQIGWSFSVPDGATDYLSAGETLTQTYTITIDDGHGGTVTKDVTVTITGTNENPVAVDDTATVFEKGPPVVISVLANDSDVDHLDVLGVTQVNGHAISVGNPVSLADGSIVSLNADGSLSYDPNGAWNALNTGQTGHEIFSYTISDGHGGTATANVDVSVTGFTDGAPDPATDPNDYDNGNGLPSTQPQGGSNTIHGGDGADTLVGTPNQDTINGFGGPDLIYGEAGNDTILGDNGSGPKDGADTIFGGSGDDTISGQGGNDTIYGGDGNDAINGGAGNDTIVGGFGADTLTGGGDADTFVYLFAKDSLQGSADRITDFIDTAQSATHDIIDLSAVAGATQANTSWSYDAVNNVTRIVIHATNGTMEIDLTGNYTSSNGGTHALQASDFHFHS
jgi:VCBS repeat-containing protein